MGNQKETCIANGTKIVNLRRAKGWTQEVLAKKAGVGRKTTYSCEHGNVCSPTTLGLIAEALEVEVSEIITGNTSAMQKHVIDFSDLITDKTSSFVGRQFVFDAIDKFVNKNSCGYYFVKGDPGIGKSTIAAKLIRDRNYIHHFNVRTDGINTAQKFLRNICHQLASLLFIDPSEVTDDCCKDNEYLCKLLKKASEGLDENEKLVIIVDALDEVNNDFLPQEVNTLYLPSNLPDGVFIVATSRNEPLRLRVQCPQDDLLIKHDSNKNKADIAAYLTNSIDEHNLLSYIKKQKLTQKSFLKTMTKKSQGNFVYLHYILKDISNGVYADFDFEQLPVGLQNYYEDHWKRMGMTNRPLPEIKIKVLYVLTACEKPVSRELLCDFSEEGHLIVQGVLDDWLQFLHQTQVDGKISHSLYHSSFQEFLYRKEVVKAAGIDMKSINKLITDNLWNELMKE
jgi:DNA-binding XRE family transcriptional regulator